MTHKTALLVSGSAGEPVSLYRELITSWPARWLASLLARPKAACDLEACRALAAAGGADPDELDAWYREQRSRAWRGLRVEAWGQR